MKNIILLTISALLFFSCASGSTQKQERQEKALLYYSQGTQKLYEKKYTSALDYLLQAVALVDDRSDIHNNLGMAYYFKKQNDKAIEHINQAIKLDERNSDARNNLATIYFEMKEYDKAQEQYLILKKDLTYSGLNQVYYNMAKMQQEKGNNAQAKEYFLLSIEERPDSCASLFELGLMEFKERKYNKAAGYFNSAYRGVCYQNAAPLYYHGLTLLRMKKYIEGKEKFELMQERFPESRYAVLALEQLQKIDKNKIPEDQLFYSELQKKMDKVQESKGFESPEF